VIVMVTGGRDFDDEQTVAQALGDYGVGDYLVVGGARGADELARRFWHYELQLPYVVHPAPWDRTGRAAGQMRNMAMVKGLSLAPYARLIPDEVVAFPGGVGTAHAIKQARLQGIRVTE
jgi:hypothetical protein